MYEYRFAGLSVRSDFPLQRLGSSQSPPHGEFAVSVRSGWAGADRPFQNAALKIRFDVHPRQAFELWRRADGDLLRWPGLADFWVQLGSRHCSVACAGTSQAVIEQLLLTRVLPYCLEHFGVVVLHGASVSLAGEVVAFVAPSGTGKSVLAAALWRRGVELLGDEMVCVAAAHDGRFVASAPLAWLHLWPQAAEQVVPDTVCRQTAPRAKLQFSPERPASEASGTLSRVYVLDRAPEPAGGTPAVHRQLSHRDATLELVRHSLLQRTVKGAGWQSRRLGFLAKLAASVPVVHLRYPSGWNYLDELVSEILRGSKAADLSPAAAANG